jgi:hydrogenase nickel incorporation protein HypB
MWPICSCGIAALTQDQRAVSDQMAASNRTHFDNHGVLAINLMSSTEAGKAALLDATIAALGDGYRIAVIEGKQGNERARTQIHRRGMASAQIRTVSACHLRASLLDGALQDLPLPGIDILFIGNAANLAGSASNDLGQHRNVTLLSSTDSNHTPAQFQQILRNTDLVLLNKAELLEVMPDIDAGQAAVALRMLGRRTPIIESVALRARSLAPWLQWIENQLRSRRSKRPACSPLIGGAVWG